MQFLAMIMLKFANYEADAFWCWSCKIAPAHNIRWPVYGKLLWTKDYTGLGLSAVLLLVNFLLG